MTMRDKKDARAVVSEWVQSFTVRSLHGMAHYARTRGLSLPQYSILMRLHHAGCEVHDIGRIFAVSPAAASQLVEKLALFFWETTLETIFGIIIMEKVFPYDFLGDNGVGLGGLYKIIQGETAKKRNFSR